MNSGKNINVAKAVLCSLLADFCTMSGTECDLQAVSNEKIKRENYTDFVRYEELSF